MAHQDSTIPFVDLSTEPNVRGFLHEPAQGRDNGDSLVLTHGAGADCQSRLLLAVANGFAESGFAVLRCDLPFRQVRPHGPPFPGGAAKDRAGLSCSYESEREDEYSLAGTPTEGGKRPCWFPRSRH
jgi:predicted alpha/beta-hydrolase family hydrolase